MLRATDAETEVPILVRVATDVDREPSSFSTTLVYVVRMLRVVQFTCIAVTALILWGLKSSLQATFQWGGPGLVTVFCSA
ncbi:hypothetical protein EMEDMD4_310014 [Sinorhizobium medicae]|uniref:Transmembrane protein n=1 Tax=Sinorhizobium medicae TaxID=110321 RepID=A0A508WWT3_9HYPH|nr:hypothetical protein EMEDMD4_310014 [Sinorhizobium medicae]